MISLSLREIRVIRVLFSLSRQFFFLPTKKMGNSTHIQMKKTLYFCSVILWFVSFDHDYHT